MLDQQQFKVIEANPIGSRLDAFRVFLKSICEDANVSSTPDPLERLGHEDVRDFTLSLLLALRILPITRLLPSRTGRGTLRDDLSRLLTAATSDSFDLNRVKPLLSAVLSDESDSLIWHQAYIAVTECTPAPYSIASSFRQNSWLRNTSSFPNSSEHRRYAHGVLKEKFGPMYVGLPKFWDTYFSGVTDLEEASEAFLKNVYEAGWTGWPEDAKADNVLDWFANFCETLAAFAETWASGPGTMDIGFVSDPRAQKDTRCRWSQILVPGELRSSPSADKPLEAWLDLGRYARQVLAAQDTRRFVLGFTICGSLMRVWAFDRIGGIASDQFDINKDGYRFVFTILGFLWMTEDELGYDPTIRTQGHERCIEIERNGSTERIILDGVLQRARCIAGRATTCWQGHPEGDPDTLLVIKDSWQDPERGKEGDLLQEAMDKGVVNVARYYYHETVQVRETDDDVRGNVRRGLDIATAKNYRPGRQTATVMPRSSRSSTSSTNRKRPASQTDPLPPSKRPCFVPTNAASVSPNRVHRRIILRDYGKPIYKASSRPALLAALVGCIKGHESLQKAGILHRDISINNLMINEDSHNPSWPSFLIDLDLAIRVDRNGSTGAERKMGTRAFMAIGALQGDEHSFMHDLESFFWVLFWICVHCEGPNRGRVVPRFDQWNYLDTELLATVKKGEVSHEGDFVGSTTEYFTAYYQSLIPCVNRLRRVVFPNGARWQREDTGLYAQMRKILEEARDDPNVSAEQ